MLLIWTWFEKSKEKGLQNYTIDPFSIFWFRKLYRNYVELSSKKLNQLAQTNPNQTIKRYSTTISNDHDYKLQKTQFSSDFLFPQMTFFVIYDERTVWTNYEKKSK